MPGRNAVDPLTEAFPRLLGTRRLAGAKVSDLSAQVQNAREFADRHVRPVALALDRATGENPSVFPHEIVRAGTRAGLLSLPLPRAAGGPSGPLVLRNALVMEELSAACSGVATIFGAHGLGASPLTMSGPVFWDGILREIAGRQHTGEPLLMGCAITEPDAGTDVEDPDLLEKARLNGHATRVPGGYRINGVKHFISNGSVAGWLTVCVPTDIRRARQTMACFLVDTSSPGFSIGRVEHKMGQRACPAAELSFDDVFVPEHRIVGRSGDGAFATMTVLAASRPVVAAIATGIARGAYERLTEWLFGTERGRRLLGHQQVQVELSVMESAIHSSRQVYMDAAVELEHLSLGRALRDPSVRLAGALPSSIRRRSGVARLLRSDAVHGAGVNMMRRRIGDSGLTRAVATSSMAKAHCADASMRVTTKALDIAGFEDPQLRAELEKCWRDAKLTQIYEGTNQLNRLEAFRGRVDREPRQLYPPRKPIKEPA